MKFLLSIWKGLLKINNYKINHKDILNVVHYIAKSIGTPSNEQVDYFSNFYEYKS